MLFVGVVTETPATIFVLLIVSPHWTLVFHSHVHIEMQVHIHAQSLMGLHWIEIFLLSEQDFAHQLENLMWVTI